MFWWYLVAIILSLMFLGCGGYIIAYLIWLHDNTTNNKYKKK